MESKLQKISILYLLFILIGIFSCTDCGPFPDKSRVTDMYFNLLQVDQNSNNISPIQNNVVRYDRLAIEIIPEVENYFSILKKIKSFSIISTAYACDPTPPVMEDKLLNIKIFSNKTYNVNYPENTNLSPIVRVFIPQTNETISLDNYLQSQPNFPSSLFLKIEEAPESIQVHQLTIKVYTNGSVVNYKEVILNPIEIQT